MADWLANRAYEIVNEAFNEFCIDCQALKDAPCRNHVVMAMDQYAHEFAERAVLGMLDQQPGGNVKLRRAFSAGKRGLKQAVDLALTIAYAEEEP